MRNVLDGAGQDEEGGGDGMVKGGVGDDTGMVMVLFW